MNKFLKLVIFGLIIASLALSACQLKSAPATTVPVVIVETQLVPVTVVVPVEVTVQTTPLPPVIQTVIVNTGFIEGQSAGAVQPTNMDGYEASPIGDLSSDMNLVIETWGPGCPLGCVIVAPLKSVVWLQKHYGQTNWWVSDAILEERIQHSLQAIKNRDGNDAVVIRLPVDTAELVGCFQTTPVENGTRHCDAIGDNPAFDAQASLPVPGLFQGYGSSASAVAGKCEGGVATGPAIVEMSIQNVATAVRVDEGKTYNYGQFGCFPLDSQAFLVARWNTHLAEFLVKYPTGASLVAP